MAFQGRRCNFDGIPGASSLTATVWEDHRTIGVVCWKDLALW
ncbi:hypothetical protein RISK_003733 [Rhodopirellula islandica]|uniref:Uncharacterized protein n=1 Tax=Rhodopirellula islandica TaxID=595434 RepID=A0A0J1BC02_RHOIS|nr:hypothetical protein RISK_003733 [Rhodopirellula islandica]